jgi:SnoaL-like domain
VTIKLPPVIQNYVEVSNRHDVKSILACFSGNAVVSDEEETLRGKEAIKDWIVKTMDKYEFHLKPVTVREDGAEIVVAIEVSGTFPGSPVTPDYHFVIENDNILSLTIE